MLIRWETVTEKLGDTVAILSLRVGTHVVLKRIWQWVLTLLILLTVSWLIINNRFDHGANFVKLIESSESDRFLGEWHWSEVELYEIKLHNTLVQNLRSFTDTFWNEIKLQALVTEVRDMDNQKTSINKETGCPDDKPNLCKGTNICSAETTCLNTESEVCLINLMNLK